LKVRATDVALDKLTARPSGGRSSLYSAPVPVLRTTSSDGTEIAYEAGGSGPSVVLVHGALSDRRHAFGAVRPLLERRVTVYALDRRGHGDSGDAPEFAPRCEHEDVAAVLAAVPGPVDLIGHSFGALCALEAARADAEIRRLVPYAGVPRDGRTISPDGLAGRAEALVREGRPEGALDLVLAEVEHHGPARLVRDHRAPRWSASVAGVAVLDRELEVENEYRFAPERYADVTAPTLVLAGAESAPSVRADAEAVAAGLPDALLTLLAGQRHGCLHRAPQLFADTVLDFLGH
jgi:pimeloyl-ACP methyl ester carboxylesterase